MFCLQGHYRYCEALFSLGEYKMAIEANKLARLLCKADPEGTKDLEQQHQKFIAEMPEPKGIFTALMSCSQQHCNSHFCSPSQTVQVPGN